VGPTGTQYCSFKPSARWNYFQTFHADDLSDDGFAEEEEHQQTDDLMGGGAESDAEGESDGEEEVINAVGRDAI